jgi:hypothetical protein
MNWVGYCNITINEYDGLWYGFNEFGCQGFVAGSYEELYNYFVIWEFYNLELHVKELIYASRNGELNVM